MEKEDHLTGDFDPEFLAQLHEMGKTPSNEPSVYVTTGDYDADHAKAVAEVDAHNTQLVKQKRRSYLTSEIPVRPCTADCPIRGSCKDYLKGRVLDNDLCKPELRQIKKWQVAFRNGDVAALKEDAGSVAGAMSVQIFRLLEKVIADGITVELTKRDQFGTTYTEIATHPALTSAMNLLKTLGLDLNSYLMTPKSIKDAPPAVQVNIAVSPEAIQKKFAARFGPRIEVGEGAK